MKHEIIGSSKGYNRIPDLRAQLEKQYEAELRQERIDEIKNRNKQSEMRNGLNGMLMYTLGKEIRAHDISNGDDFCVFSNKRGDFYSLVEHEGKIYTSIPLGRTIYSPVNVLTGEVNSDLKVCYGTIHKRDGRPVMVKDYMDLIGFNRKYELIDLVNPNSSTTLVIGNCDSIGDSLFSPSGIGTKLSVSSSHVSSIREIEGDELFTLPHTIDSFCFCNRELYATVTGRKDNKKRYFELIHVTGKESYDVLTSEMGLNSHGLISVPENLISKIRGIKKWNQN